MRSSVVILIFLQLVSDVTAVCCRLCWEDFTCDMFIIDNITSWSANQWPRHMAGIKSGGGRFTAFQDTVRLQPHVTSQGAQSNEFTSWQPFFISSLTQLCLKQRCRRYKQMTAAETTREQEERDKVWQEEGPQVFYRCSSSSSSKEWSLMGHFSLTSLWDRNKHKYLSKCLSNIHISFHNVIIFFLSLIKWHGHLLNT